MKKLPKFQKHQLSKGEIRIWSTFMTPEYVFTENNKQFCYLEDKGFDHMDRVQQIAPIAKAKEYLERITKNENK